MKPGPKTKNDKRNKALLKKIHYKVMLANYDVVVKIFPTMTNWSNAEAGFQTRVVILTFSVNSNLLSYKNK